MAPKKKETVTAEIREEWLRKHERGHSPPAIAKDAGYDPRTVRKYLDVAKREKESKEARTGVLRSALERHYEDLCRFAERFGKDPGNFRVSIDVSEIDADKRSPYAPELGVALRQHIPRSPIWGLLNKISKGRNIRAELMASLEKKIEASIRSDSILHSELADSEVGVFSGLKEAFAGQAEQWVHGPGSLDPETNLKHKPTGDGFGDLSYGAYGLSRVREGHVPLIKEAITRWTAEIKSWEEIHELNRIDNDLEVLKRNLRNEIAVIVLRRVVPGRCLYCPI